MRYRIALCGFSEFEYRAMHFSFQHPADFQESTYDVVDVLADADFAVVDADSPPAVKGVVQSGRVAQSVFVGDSAPDGAAWHLPRPIDPRRILRTLDEITARRARAARHGAPASTPAELPDPIVRELPTLDEVVLLPEPTPLDAPSPAPASNATLHRAAKAAARAAARRARLAGARAESAPVEPLRDVLVLDPDPLASRRLCELLERFGFRPHAVAWIDEAAEQLTARPFAAVFLDIALDDVGVALLQQARELPAPPGHRGPAVLMTVARLDPAERVRAALAGIAAPLVKPLARGDVARALEAAGVVLPADARRL